MREGLRTLPELHPDIHVVGEAGDGGEAERFIKSTELEPRVVLMDLRMPTSVPVPRPAESSLTESLSERELGVLRLLGRGAGNREIAEALALTEGTVKNYISAILAKTGLHDRTQASLYAVRHNLTDRDIR